jgi:ATP-binding cassette subfamily B protein
MWSVLRPRWQLLLAVLLLIPVGALLELVHPFILKRLVDDHFTAGVAEGLGTLAAVYVLAFVSIQGVTFLQTYLAATVGQNALRDLRIRLFRHFESLPVAYFDRTPSGDVISRCTADVDAVGMLFSSTLLRVFSQLARLLGVVGAMVALNARLTLIAVIAIPIVAAISHVFRPRMLSAERAVRRRVAETNAHLQEDLTGVEVIRAFGAEETFERKFRSVQSGFLNAVDRSGRYDSIFSPLIETLKATAIAFLLWYGTRPEVYISWEITLGTLAAFVHLLDGFFRPITSLGQEYQSLQRAVAGAERIFAVLSLPGEKRPPTTRAVLDRAAPEVKVTDVMFEYVLGTPVLRGVDLRIEPGEHVAVVGQTGGGKSSLMHLLAGLYVPDSGTIQIGGYDPRSLEASQRRKLIGVVPQHVHLFEGTLLENLRLGNEEISEDEVWTALDLSNAGSLVRGFADGLDTPLGVSGLTLSAGQRQLLALARALVGDPRLLLMDEATSSIDSETERLIQDGLERSSSGRTTLAVAHRLSFGEETDRVIVMRDGQIVEEGAPDVLASGAGWFAGMIELQRRGWTDER